MIEWAYIVGIVVGTVAMLTTCLVWFRKQVFGTGGAVLSLFGVMLIGMSVWGSVKITLPGGIEAELETLKGKIEVIAESSQGISDEVRNIAEVTETTRDEFVQLTRDLETLPALSHTSGLSDRRAAVSTRSLDPQRLRNINRDLDNIRIKVVP